jgi:two-component system, NarL family, response regulator NreC
MSRALEEGSALMEREEKIRVLIADDHGVLREGIAALIDAQPDMIVVGQASTIKQTVQLARELMPDVILLDLALASGSTAISAVKEASPRARALVLSKSDHNGDLRSVLAAGAAGFVAKHAASDQLLNGIREVHLGRSYVNIKIGERALSEVFDEGPARRATLSSLTKREREVLKLVAEGFTNSQIGTQLGVSKKSVDTYRARVSHKLGLKNRVDIVRYALEVGLLRSDK